MLKDIVEVRPLGDFNLYLKFEDGIEGTVDVSELVSFYGVFEPLKDASEFARVRVNRDLGSIEWPNGADLDPVVLYERITARRLSRDECRAPAES